MKRLVHLIKVIKWGKIIKITNAMPKVFSLTRRKHLYVYIENLDTVTNGEL